MRIYIHALKYIVSIIPENTFDCVEVHVSEPSSHPFVRQLAAARGWRTLSQCPGDLGAKMANVFRLNRGRPTIIIGADCVGLLTSDLTNAARELQLGSDVVICPAEDGGYVMIGAKRLGSAGFQNIKWGSSVVCQQTLSRLPDDLSTKTLPLKWDLDTKSDVLRFFEREGIRSIFF